MSISKELRDYTVQEKLRQLYDLGYPVMVTKSYPSTIVCELSGQGRESVEAEGATLAAALTKAVGLAESIDERRLGTRELLGMNPPGKAA